MNVLLFDCGSSLPGTSELVEIRDSRRSITLADILECFYASYDSWAPRSWGWTTVERVGYDCIVFQLAPVETAMRRHWIVTTATADVIGAILQPMSFLIGSASATLKFEQVSDFARRKSLEPVSKMAEENSQGIAGAQESRQQMEAADLPHTTEEIVEKKPGCMSRCLGGLFRRKKKSKQGAEEAPPKGNPVADEIEGQDVPTADGVANVGTDHIMEEEAVPCKGVHAHDATCNHMEQEHNPEEVPVLEGEQLLCSSQCGEEHRGSKIVKVDDSNRPASLFIQKGIMDRQQQAIEEEESTLGDDSEDDEKSVETPQAVQGPPDATALDQPTFPHVVVADAAAVEPEPELAHAHDTALEEILGKVPAPVESQALDVPETEAAPANIAVDDVDPVMADDVAMAEESLIDALNEGPPAVVSDAAPEVAEDVVESNEQVESLQDILRAGPPADLPEEVPSLDETVPSNPAPEVHEGQEEGAAEATTVLNDSNESPIKVHPMEAPDGLPQAEAAAETGVVDDIVETPFEDPITAPTMLEPETAALATEDVADHSGPANEQGDNGGEVATMVEDGSKVASGSHHSSGAIPNVVEHADEAAVEEHVSHDFSPLEADKVAEPAIADNSFETPVNDTIEMPQEAYSEVLQQSGAAAILAAPLPDVEHNEQILSNMYQNQDEQQPVETEVPAPRDSLYETTGEAPANGGLFPHDFDEEPMPESSADKVVPQTDGEPLAAQTHDSAPVRPLGLDDPAQEDPAAGLLSHEFNPVIDPAHEIIPDMPSEPMQEAPVLDHPVPLHVESGVIEDVDMDNVDQEDHDTPAVVVDNLTGEAFVVFREAPSETTVNDITAELGEMLAGSKNDSETVQMAADVDTPVEALVKDDRGPQAAVLENIEDDGKSPLEHEIVQKVTGLESSADAETSEQPISTEEH